MPDFLKAMEAAIANLNIFFQSTIIKPRDFPYNSLKLSFCSILLILHLVQMYEAERDKCDNIHFKQNQCFKLQEHKVSSF